MFGVIVTALFYQHCCGMFYRHCRGKQVWGQVHRQGLVVLQAHTPELGVCGSGSAGAAGHLSGQPHEQQHVAGSCGHGRTGCSRHHPSSGRPGHSPTQVITVCPSCAHLCASCTSAIPRYCYAQYCWKDHVTTLVPVIDHNSSLCG